MNFEELHLDTCSNMTLAAIQGNKEVMQLLISESRSVNIEDNKGWQPLHHAVHNGHLECILVLLKHEDIEVNALTYEKESALLIACKSEMPCDIRVKIVKKLLLFGADPNIHGLYSWSLPLNAAIINDDYDTVEALLRNGANPNVGDDKSGPPLNCAAAFTGNPKLLLLLLHFKADIYQLGNHKMTPLHSITNYSTKRNLDCLNVIIKACPVNHFVNAQTVTGSTALMLTCLNNWPEAAHVILHNGADPILCRDDQIFPLHYAVQEMDENYLDDPDSILSVLFRVTTDFWRREPIFTCNTHSIFNLAFDVERYKVLDALFDAGLNVNNFEENMDTVVRKMYKWDYEVPKRYKLVEDFKQLIVPFVSYMMLSEYYPSEVEYAKKIINMGICDLNPPLPYLPPLIAACFFTALSENYCNVLTVVDLLLRKGANLLYKIRPDHPIPSCLLLSSHSPHPFLYHYLLSTCIPASVIYNQECINNVFQYYSIKYMQQEDDDFIGCEFLCEATLKWLNVLWYHLPQLPSLDEKHVYFWSKFKQPQDGPKSLMHLSTLAVRMQLWKARCKFVHNTDILSSCVSGPCNLNINDYNSVWNLSAAIAQLAKDINLPEHYRNILLMKHFKSDYF